MSNMLKLSVNSKTDDITLFPAIKCDCDPKNGKYSYSFYARKKVDGVWYIQGFHRGVEYPKQTRDRLKTSIEFEVINTCLKPILIDVYNFYDTNSISNSIKLPDGRVINQVDENQED